MNYFIAAVEELFFADVESNQSLEYGVRAPVFYGNLREQREEMEGQRSLSTQGGGASQDGFGVLASGPILIKPTAVAREFKVQA